MHSLKRWRANHRKLRAGSVAVLALTLGASASAWAQDPNAELNTRVALPYNQAAVDKLLSNARFLGHQSPDTPVKLVFMLPLRNQTDLDSLLHRLYDPNDSLYRHFLTPQQFTEQFGPTEDDYNTVISYAESAGFKVTGTTPSRTLLDVEGTTESVESAFGLRINRYLMPDGRVSYAAEGLPSVPKWLANRVTGVVGLNNLSARHHHHTVADALKQSVKSYSPHAGNGPAGGYTPHDIKTAYNVNTTLKGEGESVALYELDGYSQTDISTYAQNFGLGTPHLQNIFVDGYDGSLQDPTFGGQVEVELDIDMVLAVAPNVSNLYVYGAKNASPDALDEWQRIANDNLAKVISTSWGLPEDLLASGEAAAENSIFQQMQAQGQAIFDASGDNGAFDDPKKATTAIVDDPAGQPLVTGVGGTTLTINSLSAYLSETAWSGSGGGISSIWAKPSYQTGVFGKPGTTNREVPDVSLNADPKTGYDIFVTNAGGWITVGGTSSAAPLWAAFAALVNQQLVKSGSNRIGFMNPSLYAIAKNATKYAADFHDITTGNNGANGGFTAAAGFDDVTGWGTFNGNALLNDLALPANAVPGIVTGTATDQNGNPINVTTTTGTTPTTTGGVTVKAVNTSNGLVFTTTTDTTGKYTLSLVSGFTYTISADATNYAGASVAGVTIPVSNGTGGTVTENFTLVTGHVYNVGLQMISAPYEFTGLADFGTLFGTTNDPPVGFPNGTDPLLYIWQPNLNQYVITPSYPADTMHLGNGYWTNLKQNTYLHRQGTPASTSQSFRIVLLKGWNMIGDPFPFNVAVSGLQVDTLSASGPVAISQSTTVGLPFYTYGPTSTAYKSVTSTDTLQPFAGYWVYTSADCVLVVPPTIAPPTPPI